MSIPGIRRPEQSRSVSVAARHLLLASTPIREFKKPGNVKYWIMAILQQTTVASQLLIDRKRHATGSFALRGGATTIWTAWGAATWVGNRDRHTASSGDGR